MKLKKLFAGIVAVAMMATMAMPSFAAKHTYDETRLEDHSSITVTKVYTGRYWLQPQGDVYFGAGRRWRCDKGRCDYCARIGDDYWL